MTLSWEKLNTVLQTLLPCEDEITYVIGSYKENPKYRFEGVPENNFDLVVHVNLKDITEAKHFLD